MSCLLVTLVAAVLFSSGALGKTVTGLFKSEVARQQNGQFITKFMYQGDNGLLVCRLDNSALATEKESRLLLYQDMDSDLDNLSCTERLAKAHFTISLHKEEFNQTIPRQSSPTAWQALYTDRYTCQESAVIPSHADLSFTLLLLNADSAGNPLEHFSAEEAGLHSFYFLLLLAYFIACCIYIQPLYQALRKGGPMNTVLKVLTMALALQGCSALCNYIHLARYSRDGIGIPLIGSLAEFWDMVSQVSMLYMLLSLCMGWTLSRGRKPQSRPLQWEQSPASTAVAVGGVVTQGVLLLWEQYSESESDHHSYHAQRSLAGVLLIALRVGLALLLASVLYQIISTERSTLKRDFYLCFAKGCFLWFLCHPVLVLMSVVFNEHQREKVVTIGVILCQSISMVILYQLFLSRSLYWEVSSLSSVSLPLTMSRTNHRGRY
ncbi:integral membrane protein GPR180 [Seriola lalandi dorsalis]|uniref:G protein-coupled receptor 180 n=1 Tax=Seriola lalandi dorsalis TaxID=1841481 RepID=A0A3B4WFQ9_SERLL|nr:integral membrane protein GPR180 [Seriola lalandi dorsalis]XP_056226050.1 integral membrane protein GPR180 [Seriola aureovittata]